MNKWIAMLIVFLLGPTMVHSQQPDERAKPSSVTVSGEAMVLVEPDQAEIDIGVITQTKSAPEAARGNAEKLSKVLTGLKGILSHGDEVKTASYALNPNYRYPRQGGKPEIQGYTATNILHVKTARLDMVGRLIDTAMQSGANTVHHLLFNLRDEQSAQHQALRLATMKAKAKAEEIANALDLNIASILSVAESDRGIRPILQEAERTRMEAMAAPTPVEAGTIQVRSSVTLIAESSQK
jgi:uncharacterized protein